MAFNQIRGNDRGIGVLKECLKRGSFAGAYLFCGPEGIGKFQAALSFAKALNCKTLSTDACESCPSCRRIEARQHPDVHCISAADSAAIKIEDIRALKKEIGLRPYEARKKVFIVDDCHLLTADAANAVLKVLEEPPADSVIILVTSRPQLLFRTIVSRCQAIRFSALSREDLEGLLKEEFRLDTDFAHFLAYFCEGRLGAALRLKDTDIMRRKNRVIDEFTVLNRPGAPDEPAGKAKTDLRESFAFLAAWFRDLSLVKIGAPHMELVNLDRREELLGAMGRYSFREIDDIMHFISEAVYYLQHNINTRLLVSNLKVQLWRG